jgi:hypothetical protein
MHARALSGAEGIYEMLIAYADLIDRLEGLWRRPVLTLPARPQNYDVRTDELVKWAGCE